MIEIAEAIKKKKWGVLLILAGLALFLFMGKSTISYISDQMKKDTIKEFTEEELTPELKKMNELIEEVKEEVGHNTREIKKISNDLSIMNDNTVRRDLDGAISAYSKIFTIKDLENNPQNCNRIKYALQNEKSKEVLMGIDKKRTTLFLEYFNY